MNREQLGYFILAYQSGSFAEAAARVPMSVQGFKKAMRSLEAEFGVPLFECDGRGLYAPTAFADELFGFADRLETDYEALLGRFDSIRLQERNVIRLGTSLGVIGLLGPEFLDGFHAANPTITVEYDEIPDLLCDKRLKMGACDMALSLFPYDATTVTTELYSSRVCFWVRGDDPLAGKPVLEAADLAGRAVAMCGKEIKIYWRIREACEKAGVELGEISTSSEIFWIYNFVLCGKGLGFCVEHLTKLPVFTVFENLTNIPFEDMRWRFGISYLPEHGLSPAEQIFYDYCLAYSKNLPRYL